MQAIIKFKLQSDAILVHHFTIFDDVITELIAAGAKIDEMGKVSLLTMTRKIENTSMNHDLWILLSHKVALFLKV